jgi:hypothetical protein
MSSNTINPNDISIPQQQHQQSQPRDGPATTFEADPLIQCIESNDDNFFALVLVAGWPPDLSVMDAPYQRLLTEIRTNVLLGNNNHDHDKYNHDNAVYLYPTQHLHVTIATLVPLQRKKKEDNDAHYEKKLRNDYTNLVRRMSNDPKWPKQPMQLELDRIQLGAKAGILLWKETTGGMATIRQLLMQYAAANDDEAKLEIHAIPGIIHSSFCRFRTAITSDGDGGGAQLQERFQTHVVDVPKDKSFFPSPIPISSVTLVCERTPYMHIPDDDRHVFLRTQLK